MMFSCIFVAFPSGIPGPVLCLVDQFLILAFFTLYKLFEFRYLQASKDLDEPTHTCSLKDASAFLSDFTLYIIQVWVVFYCIWRCFLVLSQTIMQEFIYMSL